MFKIKFIKLSKIRKTITGGHVYDNNLFDTIGELKDIELSHTWVGVNKKIPKLFCAFIEPIKTLFKSKADILVFNSSYCLRLLPVFPLLKLFPKKKVYTIHHHSIYLEFRGLKRQIYKTAEALCLKFSDKIIVPSPYIYDTLKKNKNPKDLLLWRIPFETKQEFIPLPITGNLTFTGTIEPRKGIIYLLKALKILQDEKVEYYLNILGKITDKNYYIQLKKYIEDNNLKVNFRGFVEMTEKNKILSETDIFVFPSILEGFGMVLVEAQVYGLPIVSFDNSAMPFTVKNNINGFTVSTGDSYALANRIKEIIIDRNLRNKLSEGAYKNLKSQWSKEEFNKTVKDYFTNIIKEK